MVADAIQLGRRHWDRRTPVIGKRQMSRRLVEQLFGFQKVMPGSYRARLFIRCFQTGQTYGCLTPFSVVSLLSDFLLDSTFGCAIFALICSSVFSFGRINLRPMSVHFYPECTLRISPVCVDGQPDHPGCRPTPRSHALCHLQSDSSIDMSERVFKCSALQTQVYVALTNSLHVLVFV